MTNWTENLCPNPSFEIDLTGYTALTGTILARDTTQGFAGHASMTVETDGTVPGEGFFGPEITVPATGPGSVSLYILGAAGASLTVSAVSGATPVVIASTNVTLAGGDYQRVILSGLSLTSGQVLYVLVQTTTAQMMNFWVDAVQYEMNAAAHSYIDGSFVACFWEGTPGASASFQPYQFGTAGSGGMFLEGTASPVTQGEVFPTSAEGTMTLSGTEAGTLVVDPAGAMTDFGIWTAADMDPAVSYIEWSNAGASTGRTTWNRAYALAYPPRHQVSSAGATVWHRAAYAAVGFTFKAVPTTIQQSLADVQLEPVPVVPGVTPVPGTFQPPRQVNTIIKPTRLNFMPNPSIEISTAGWTAINSASLSQDATVAVDGHSLKVTVHASQDGAYIVIPDLIVGDTYVVSAAVQGGPGLQDVIMTCAGVQASSAEEGIPYGGDAILDIGFGQGPYGGIEAAGTDMPTGQWFTPSAVFTATQSAVVLSFQILAGSDIAYPTEFWVDTLLLEAGEIAGEYFDGGFGPDYSWETGGSSGLTRSYYYERQGVASGAVTSVLAEHTPLGITAATPIYSQPYSQ